MVKWIKFESGQEIYTVECPKCKKVLNNQEDEKEIIVDMLSEGGSGRLHLSAIWGDFSHLIEGSTVAKNEVIEMVCPFCNKSLLSEDNCEICGATTTLFGVSEGFLKICNRRGCKMHLRFLLTGE